MGSRKNKYIPNLAEFYFKPDMDWSQLEAQQMYLATESPLNDQIVWGDCITGMQSMPENSVDLVVADPPFGIDFSGKEAVYNRKEENVVEGYHEVIEDYSGFTNAWIKELPRIMKKTASAYIFSGYTHLKEVLEAIDESGLILKNHIIWQYNFGVFTKKKFSSSHYHVLFLVKNDKKYFFNRIEHYNIDVWPINRTYAQGTMKNGTKLPEEVVRKCIDFSSKPGDLIFDPFMGNGTTATTAKANFRHYYGYELNENMKTIINKNLENYTIGARYTPYAERLRSVEELSKDHENAYAIYCKQQKLKENNCESE